MNSVHGTRSSALLMIRDETNDYGSSRLSWSHGAPCENDYEDHSTLLRELSRTAGYDAGETVTRSGS